MDNYNLRILDILSNNFSFILQNPYIVGMGYGKKSINNKETDIPSLTFLVKKSYHIYIYIQNTEYLKLLTILLQM